MINSNVIDLSNVTVKNEQLDSETLEYMSVKDVLSDLDNRLSSIHLSIDVALSNDEYRLDILSAIVEKFGGNNNHE